MLIDCDDCRVRGPACGECVVSVLLGGPPDGVDLDADERRALRVLADAGMVPQLRLVLLDGPAATDTPRTATGTPLPLPDPTGEDVRRTA